jgi:hypothetical protein
MLDSMPDWMKYAGITTAAQGLSGMAGGYFQGQSAEEQLAQQQLQNDRAYNQMQYLNSNNQYAPKLNFARPGLINA